MKNNDSEQLARKFFELIRDYSPRNEKWLSKRRQTQEFYERNLDGSTTSIEEKLHLLNGVENTRIHDIKSVAEKLTCIQDFGGRVQAGDDKLIFEVVQAFSTPGSQNVTWSQFHNALHYLALHAPQKYVEINAFTEGILKQMLSGTDQLKGCLRIIPFNKVYDIYKLVKALYEAIKEVAELPNASYGEMYEKLTDWSLSVLVVLSNPKLLHAERNILIDAIDTYMKANGIILPELPTREIMRHIGKILGQYTNPYLEKVHEHFKKELTSYRNNHKNPQLL